MFTRFTLQHRTAGAWRTACILASVSHANVEALIGRLVTDPTLRRRFAEDPAATLRQCEEDGYELTAVEFDALAATAPEAIRSLAAAMDRRLRKADYSPGCGFPK